MKDTGRRAWPPAPEKERKWQEKRDSEENYLLEALPLAAPKVTVLETLKPVALEAAARAFSGKSSASHDEAMPIVGAVSSGFRPWASS